MLRVVRVEQVGIHQITGIDSWRSLIQDPRTKDIERSIKSVGLLSLPRVRVDDGRIVNGRKRIAALARMGQPRFDAEVVAGSDLDIEIEQIHDRIHSTQIKGNDRRTLEKRLRKLEANRKASMSDFFIEDRQRGSGELPDTKRKRKPSRKEIKARPPAKKGRRRGSMSPPIDMMGLTMDGPDWYDELRAIRSKISSVKDQADTAYHICLSLQEEPAFEESRSRELLELIERLGRMCDDVMPVAVCPGCKGLSVYCRVCERCNGNGYATAPQIKNTPECLLNRKKLVIYYKGSFIDYEEAAYMDARELAREKAEEDSSG